VIKVKHDAVSSPGSMTNWIFETLIPYFFVADCCSTSKVGFATPLCVSTVPKVISVDLPWSCLTQAIIRGRRYAMDQVPATIRLLDYATFVILAFPL
jgi:hypothetical protein